MSRSYKKHPCRKLVNNYMKHYANKRVRQRLKNCENIYHGNEYRRLTSQYDVCDSRWYAESFDSWYADAKENRRKLFWFLGITQTLPTREESKKEYEKWYCRK